MNKNLLHLPKPKKKRVSRKLVPPQETQTSDTIIWSKIVTPLQLYAEKQTNVGFSTKQNNVHME